MTDAPPTLSRWQLGAYGRQHLSCVEAPMPTPGPGQILVRVAAASLNYRDLLMIDNGMGTPFTAPWTPGSDMAGRVLAVGDGVTRWQAGDEVISTFYAGWLDGRPTPEVFPLGGPGPGMLATHVLLDAQWVAAAPATLSPAQASTLPCAALTAWFALIEQGALRAGQTVLIHGTGGVALFGLQLARLHGARTVVVSGDPAKRAQVLAMGATHALARDADWVAELHALTQGHGADHVLELVGGANMERSLQALAPGGRLSVIGVLDGDRISTSAYPVIRQKAVLQGIGVGHRRALEDLVRAIDVNRLTPTIAASYVASDLPAALDHLARGAFGKVVVTF
ncbi:NAD(P)-dependent alcohol dehydrogenase [Hydrogenophaga taeniospiralis]|uniref:zinc-dependent alcohol dehydrogenase family protein n=1 Tax=Hydrogenophaga taeniospiralis TaxID=65656 RepID=UPI001CFC06B3|nr:NAD(P)-dependent alcohol dehydrogenase [Hydrogenophaga taeniospiralis]MCB4363543.1 NAD(P)-dependent alcohol dehydrogenase [Hydrogenophaga taeniospiralis]